MLTTRGRERQPRQAPRHGPTRAHGGTVRSELLGADRIGVAHAAPLRRVRRRDRRWTCAAGCSRVVLQRRPGVKALGRAGGKTECTLAGRDATLALARLRLARREATACLTAGHRLGIVCTTPAAVN